MNLRFLAPMVMVALAATGVAAGAQTPERDQIAELLKQVEQSVQTGSTAHYLALVADSADREQARAFADFELLPGVTRAVLQERDREPLRGTLPASGFSIIADVFIETGDRARAATWRLDVKRSRNDAPWRIVDQEQITSVEGLYRLSISPTKQFDARNLRISAEDFDLKMASGTVFVAETDQGTTALVLFGRGEMRFAPAPQTEKGQVKIFCGKETLETAFDTAFVRLNPGDVESRVTFDRFDPRAVDQRALRRAEDVFREESPKSFSLDLGDLSREPWSLLPSIGDFLAEVRTRRFDTLTYARSSAEAEDITLFDRKRHRNISVYASAQKLARRGRFYNEDDLTDYDVLDYDIDVAFSPERQFLDGRAQIRVRVKAAALATMTLRLADPLVVRSIASDRFSRLFAGRVKGQNSIVINLPTAAPRDTVLTLTLVYGGRLEPQKPDRETVGPAQSEQSQEVVLIQPELSLLYSNRSYWYPQSPVTDYATATLRIAVPPTYDCVASGDLAAGSPSVVPAAGGVPGRKQYMFTATQPLRYLAFLVSRFVRSDTATIALAPDPPGDNDGLPPLTGAAYESLSLAVETNPRQVHRGHEYAPKIADIAQFYTSLVGDCPYPSFTLALVEHERPGGHSPGYFAALNQPLMMTPSLWRNDPEVFESFPEFYLAHELAHQWWGQAVGWRNYHEQWLSEGLAQYFSALYAQHQRGSDVFESVMRRLRRFGMDESPQGPIYLGYRLGHIRGEPRVFSALVYNKSAAVLHMLRRLVGDERFFRGIRRFYRSSRFQKVGTEDLRAAMETEAGRSLDRFFERWIYGSALPKLKLSYRVDGSDLVLHVDQTGEVFDVPLTVTLDYGNRKPADVVIPVTDRTVEMRVRLAGTLRDVEFNKDDGTLAEVDIERAHGT